jgi:hypothetical protein
MQSMADLNWRYHDAAFPLSFPNDADHVGLDDELLPEKTSKEKETDPYAYYFDFADKAKAKLEARGLWVKDETDGKWSAKPDAGERLKTAFSTFLTSFVSLGASNQAAKPDNLLPGVVFSSGLVTAPITGAIFVFNKIVSLLKEAFPSQSSYLDQAGKLSYFSASAAHSVVSAALPVVSEIRSSSIDPIFSIVLVSIELLLGFYATVTATQAGLARQDSKCGHLTDLINAKPDTESFVEKARTGERASASEAAAYEKFMTAIGKLDELSAESKFDSKIAATSATKEWLWFGGAVIGNETAYKNLASTQIGVSGVELVATTLSEMVMALVANIIDLVHGPVVACRLEKGIQNLSSLGNKLHDFSGKATWSVMNPLIKGLERILGKNIEDAKFEQNFSKFRIFKALVLVSIGIVAIAAFASAAFLAMPWLMGAAAGTALAAFFVYLIVRLFRTADSVRDDEKAEKEFQDEHKESEIEFIRLLKNLARGGENRFFLFHALSASLVDFPDLWEKESELDLLFKTLNFQEIEIAVLRTLAKTYELPAENDENSEERSNNRGPNIGLVRKELTRMMKLKLAGA